MYIEFSKTPTATPLAQDAVTELVLIATAERGVSVYQNTETSWEHGSDITNASTPPCLPEAPISASLYPKFSFPISFWTLHQPSPLFPV